MENEHDETTETGEGSEPTSSGNETSNENGTSTSSSENDGSQEQESSESEDGSLTEVEKQRREELLQGTGKEVNDLKSQHGREKKELQQQLAEKDAVIAALSQNNSNTNGDTTTGTSDNEEPTFHTPSGDFLNEDGTLNKEALDEWNYLSNQKLYHEMQSMKKTLESLGIDVSEITTSATRSQEAADFKRRYGLSDEVFANYQSIKESKGEFDAIEYLNIEKKEADAIKAAQAHRDNQRSPNLFSNGGAPMSPTGDENIAEQVAKEILEMPRGDSRNSAVQSIPFKYPRDVSSQILRLVANGS